MKLNAAVAYIALLGLGSFGNAELVQDACPARSLMETDSLGTRRQLSTRRRLFDEAIVSNGVVKLGINDEGSLNVAGGTGSVSGETDVGLRVLRPDGEYEATAQGCSCEGWGASFTPTGGIPRSGYANRYRGNDGLDSTMLSAISASEATSTVTIGDLKVTHRFKPSPKTNQLYEVEVTYENMGTVNMEELRYRRVMDWDADPTPFSECVSIVTGNAAALEAAGTNGFVRSNPFENTSFFDSLGFSCPSAGCPTDCSAGNCDIGPRDHGAVFQFLFKNDDGTLQVLPAGASFSFKIFYGGAQNKSSALAALGLVGAEAYSFGYSSRGGCSAAASGGPVTYMFGFSGVGGTPVVDPETRPDPHFKTFGNEWFDFHGGCDLVLLDIPNFGFGPGLTVHIRTTVRYAYSFIETAAIRIGNDILEVSSFGQYMLNGISNADLSEKLSGYTVEHSIPGKNLHQFYIDLKDGRHFTVKVLKDMVSFSFHLPGTDEEFGETVGLLGHYHTGARLARDGATLVEDPNDFGQEWQVRDTDPELLFTQREPQFPAKCIMPDPVERASRRLEATISMDAASLACEHVTDKQVRDMCIFDVISTDDLSVATSGVY